MPILPTQMPGTTSPCINLCRIDPASGLCRGCRRTIDEIAAWAAMTDGERRAVVALLATRPLPVEEPA
jgi:uncharacterized protein